MGTDPPYLGDRRPQLARFREYLAEPGIPHNVLVTGLRGVGKTVLLNRYSDEAESTAWLAVDREWSEADAEPGTFAQLILADLLHLGRRLSLSERVKAAAGGLGKGALDLLSGLSVSYEGVEVGYKRGGRRPAPRRLDDDLRQALSRVGEEWNSGPLTNSTIRATQRRTSCSPVSRPASVASPTIDSGASER